MRPGLHIYVAGCRRGGAAQLWQRLSAAKPVGLLLGSLWQDAGWQESGSLELVRGAELCELARCVPADVELRLWAYPDVDGRDAVAQDTAARIRAVPRLRGLLLDPEKHWQAHGKPTRWTPRAPDPPPSADGARELLKACRAAVGPDRDLGVTSYPFPTLQRRFIWGGFRDPVGENLVDYYSPQVYGLDRQGMERSLREYSAAYPGEALRPSVGLFRLVGGKARSLTLPELRSHLTDAQAAFGDAPRLVWAAPWLSASSARVCAEVCRG